jgi:uncharacterized protein YutE (UPF0331/DUF86 family)
MTFLVERLTDLRRHLDHLETLSRRVPDRRALDADLSLHNDVLFSLLMTAQLVIDIASEIAARQGRRFEDYTGAIRALGEDRRFPAELIRSLERLPGFRNVLVHEYVSFDLDRAVAALHDLAPVRQFTAIVATMERSDP